MDKSLENSRLPRKRDFDLDKFEDQIMEAWRGRLAATEPVVVAVGSNGIGAGASGISAEADFADGCAADWAAPVRPGIRELPTRSFGRGHVDFASKKYGRRLRAYKPYVKWAYKATF